jgi:hypothetical protein
MRLVSLILKIFMGYKMVEYINIYLLCDKIFFALANLLNYKNNFTNIHILTKRYINYRINMEIF